MKRGRGFGSRLASAVHDRVEDRAGAVHDRVDAIGDQVNQRVDPDQMQVAKTLLRTVGVRCIPIEVLLSATAVRAIIKMADDRGLLESPNAQPLKELARLIDDNVPMSEQQILSALPRIARLGLVTKVLGGDQSKAAQRLETIAGMAARSNSVREVVHKYKAQHGDEAPGVS